jgi:hypothetical protein
MAMVQITVDRGILLVSTDGMDHQWTRRRPLAIPLAHVRRADPLAFASRAFMWVRTAAGLVPLVAGVGTFLQGRELAFWYVRNPDKAVVIELAHERYARLVLEVEDPTASIALIERALKAWPRPRAA